MINDLNLPKKFIPIYNASFFRGYYPDYEITDVQIRDLLTALSEARNEADVLKNELIPRVERELAGAKVELKLARMTTSLDEDTSFYSTKVGLLELLLERLRGDSQ